jgi:HEAT repeat protein
VRLYATEALGRMRDPKAVIELRNQLPRSRGAMLEATLLALARIGSAEDVELFRARAADRTPAIRRAAIEGLGRAGDKAAIELFERAFKSDRDESVRLAAAFALTLAGRSQTHVIAANLAVADLTGQAREYLFEIGRATVPALQATLKVVTDGRHRADLAQLIGYLGAPEHVAILEPLAADPDERVRRAVGHAIQRLRR